ncbi:hypothetical protein BBF96_10915 [Anoxybacter fermentans]|uniref:Uncharacterized protein n=1 Tax=Anoxybacter fermentans TaxID=1323375 RepID=A0A3Q9HR28_9FIRM|nr:DUF2802 domain-containing protein [Anoxybacter fermentans]AZR73853.1 hypothetical protein BBF96_10915 [Anoxybacter fermentans]
MLVAYLILGVGMFLILISLISTYRINRKINSERVGEVKANSIEQVIELVKTKESIRNIGKELDTLIEELREKESEIKAIIKKVKEWNLELSDPVFSEILAKKIAYQEADRLVDQLYESERFRRKEEELDLRNRSEEPLIPSKTRLLEKEALARYNQIVKLSEEGLSVEEIARKLNLGYREVELVVKLRKKGAGIGV